MAISSPRYSPSGTGYDQDLASQVPEAFMKALFGVGLVILVLGILSFFVPIPHSEHHGVSAGDLHVGVNTEHSDRVAPAISVVLVVAGAGMMIAGRKGV
jgi:hypothetical protein